MVIGWTLVIVLVWMKYNLDRRIYRLAWYLAASAVILAGLLL